MKRCRKCGEMKLLDDYHRSSRASDGRQSVCKTCNTAQVRAWYQTNPERARTKARERSRRFRDRALAAYSTTDPPSCACCGDSHYEFLCIDHVDGKGSAHRKEVGSSNIYPWLNAHGYPPGFAVLCHNCNIARSIYGTCPHEVERAGEVSSVPAII
jgi:hypothetical protein